MTEFVPLQLKKTPELPGAGTMMCLLSIVAAQLGKLKLVLNWSLILFDSSRAYCVHTQSGCNTSQVALLLSLTMQHTTCAKTESEGYLCVSSHWVR